MTDPTPHPQQWLLDMLVEYANAERQLVYDENGNPMRSATLAEIELAEAKVVDLKASYERGQTERHKWDEAAKLVRQAMGLHQK